MKKYIPFKAVTSALSVIALVTIMSCEQEEDTSPLEPYRLVVSGPGEVAPSETHTYYTSLYEGETYAWAVPSGATIVDGEGTFSIDVTFTAAGSGDITVERQGIRGAKTVAVVTSAPVAEVTLADTTVAALTEGGTANVLISFDKDIATVPEVMLMPAEGVTGSMISAVEKVDDRTFQVTYTAGAGDGTDKISVDKAVSSELFGAVVMDTIVTFDAYPVDNTPATGELSASLTPVDDSTMTMISATFSEPLSTTDSVKISINGLTNAYVTEAAMTTEDGLVWTYGFQPEGGASEVVSVSVSNLPADLAGNPTEEVASIIVEVNNE